MSMFVPFSFPTVTYGMMKSFRFRLRWKWPPKARSALADLERLGAVPSSYICVTLSSTIEARLRMIVPTTNILCAAFALQKCPRGSYENFFSFKPNPGRIAVCIQFVRVLELRSASGHCVAHGEDRQRRTALLYCRSRAGSDSVARLR